MSLSIYNTNTLVAASQTSNPFTVNLPSATDLSSVALAAATRAENAAATVALRDTLANLIANTTLAIGDTVIATDGYNGQEEVYKVVTASTYTADNNFVHDLTGSSGQAVSLRQEYASFAEAATDPRTTITMGWPSNVIAQIQNVGFIQAGTTGDWQNAGGQHWTVLETDGYAPLEAFGDNSGGDWTVAIQRAEASSSTYIRLEKKTYAYNSATITSLTKVYFGPGFLDNGAGYGNPKTSAIPLSANNVWDWESALDYATVLQRLSSNQVSRLYVMPKGTPTGATLAAFKVFFDDFRADPNNYRDFNLSPSATVNGGTFSANGGVLINLKTLGTYRTADNPDIVFTYNDAVSTNFIAGRIVQHWVSGVSYQLWNFGPSVPVASLPQLAVARFERDAAFDNGAGIRWANSSGSYNSLLVLNSSNQLAITINGSSAATVDANGSWISTNGLSQFSRKAVPPYSGTYATTYAPDFNNGSVQKVYLTGNATISAPANSVLGSELELHFTADTSNKTLTFASQYKLGSYSTTVIANTTNVYRFRRMDNTPTWRLVAAPAIGV